MKKIIINILITIILIIPINVYASCTVVSGTGKNIGDEISCNGENFYIISNDGEEVIMLAKYNLYVGMELYYIEFDDPIEFSYSYGSSTGWNYVYNGNTYESYYDMFLGFLEENGYGTYDNVYDMDYDYISSGNYSLNWIKVYNNLDYTDVLQSSSALGVSWDDNGNLIYPAVGHVELSSYCMPRSSGSSSYSSEGFVDMSKDYYGEYNEYEVIQEYLDEYSNSLNNLGLDITDISILSLTDIDDLVYNISGNNLAISDWYAYDLETKFYNDYGYLSVYSYKLGSLTYYLSFDYSWLWSTTYWTRTINYDLMNNEGILKVVFVDSIGDLDIEYLDCSSEVSAGIRPVVTMSSSNIIYKVSTKTDGNGEIEVSTESGYYGDLVTFSIKANSGYTLSTLTLTDNNGKSVVYEIYTEEYSFTISSDTIIEATFTKIEENVIDDSDIEIEEENPNTGVFIPIIIISYGFIIAIVIIYKANKKGLFHKI